MGERYRNVGGPHRRADGTWVAHGDTFTPTAKELAGGAADKFVRVATSEPFRGADIGIRALPMAEGTLKLALKAGLKGEDFEGVAPEGPDGQYTRKQVMAMIDARKAE